MSPLNILLNNSSYVTLTLKYKNMHVITNMQTIAYRRLYNDVLSNDQYLFEVVYCYQNKGL